MSRSRRSLKLTSCVSEKADFLCRVMADYLANHLELQVDFVNDSSWSDRLRALIDGEIDLGWLCGLLYAQLSAGIEPSPSLLAAPVMQESRYASQPIYFSDVVVRRNSGIERFEELRGAILAYNEPNSFSGYHVLRLHLAEQGETLAFFGRAIESGAHSRSLEMIVSGQVDTAAIDSTVLDLVQRSQPDLAAQLRTVAVLGPNPSPPWVASRRVPLDLQYRIRRALLTLADSPKGQTVLAETKLIGFVEVEQQSYETMRQQVETIS